MHTLITGTEAMLTGRESPQEGIIAEILVSVPAISIAGGTDEIQRNIIAERVLDLPEGAAVRHRPIPERAKELGGPVEPCRW